MTQSRRTTPTSGETKRTTKLLQAIRAGRVVIELNKRTSEAVLQVAKWHGLQPKTVVNSIISTGLKCARKRCPICNDDIPATELRLMGRNI